MNKKQLRKRILMGVERYLEDNGWEVEERDFMGFMVAWDEGTLVFISIDYCMGDVPERVVTRKEFEDVCVLWCIEHDEVSYPIRCDLFDMRIVKENAGFTRHEVGHKFLY